MNKEFKNKNVEIVSMTKQDLLNKWIPKFKNELFISDQTTEFIKDIADNNLDMDEIIDIINSICDEK